MIFFRATYPFIYSLIHSFIPLLVPHEAEGTFKFMLSVSKLVITVFYFFCMNLGDHKCSKVTEPDFPGNIPESLLLFLTWCVVHVFFVTTGL